MKKTKTSSFGTGKRESHDSSLFYNRNLYKQLFARPESAAELSKIPVPEPQGWANQIYNQSSENMNPHLKGAVVAYCDFV